VERLPDLLVKDLRKSFGDTTVLSGVSFQVRNGEFLSLLGPSGCGKTTILRIINGLEPPDSGSVSVDGRDITRLPPEKRRIGMVFQNYALFPTMTVFNNIAYGLKIRRMSRTSIREKVGWALKLVALEGLGDRKVTRLSGGQQQRVALARALVIDPDILLLDEPLSALDRKIRGEMQYELKTIQQKVGITTVFVTHDQEEALTMSDRVILMRGGTVEQESDPWTIYNHPVSIFASDFLGKSNILDATLEQRPDAWHVVGEGWDFPVTYRGGRPGDLVSVAVRGEHFVLKTDPDDGGSPFVIEKKIFTGPICRLLGSLGRQTVELAALSAQAEKYSVGDTLYVRPSLETTLYFPRSRK